MTSDNTFNAEEALRSLQDFINSNEQQLQAIYDRQYGSDSENVEKKIACQHELIFTIKAKAMEENEKGETIQCKEVCVKNYHIPVPIDKDYNEFMNTFFEFLEKCIGGAATHAYGDKSND